MAATLAAAAGEGTNGAPRIRDHGAALRQGRAHQDVDVIVLIMGDIAIEPGRLDASKGISQRPASSCPVPRRRGLAPSSLKEELDMCFEKPRGNKIDLKSMKQVQVAVKWLSKRL